MVCIHEPPSLLIHLVKFKIQSKKIKTKKAKSPHGFCRIRRYIKFAITCFINALKIIPKLGVRNTRRRVHGIK